MTTSQVSTDATATRVRRLVRVAGLATAGHWLLYVIEKVYLAGQGRIGMVGSPIPPEAYADIPNPALAQLGNAAFGLVPVAIAVLAITPAGRRIPRPLLLLGLCVVLALTLALGALLLGQGNWLHLAIAAAGLVAIVSLAAASFLRLPGTAHARPVSDR
ncbi:hypothetical protein [Microlunatus parietis]|uniref:Uncharacterized protein n=1 Tax=Microlunatus parietis TaxID=682979 RepID=A0A7Y9IEG4_9ACTN|nr:hypothetical protein [Microlunatus parietis]NYE75126.1 hypothetical protein [Microlunatus parietis]